MRKILLLSVSLLLAVTTVFAERVSQEDAALVAKNFLNPTSVSGVKKAPARPMVLKAAAAEDNQFYVYENASGEGWVMVAADDAITPILAYSKTGSFRTDNMPRNMQHWVNNYNQFIKRVVDDGAVASEEAQAQWKQLRKGLPDDPAGNVVVGPLVKTTWDQGAPFDLLTPGTGTWGNGTKAATGCVATAMAQVMNYWKWPVKGVGSHSYTPLNPNTCKSQTKYGEQSADFGNTTYDWANMLNAYTDEDGEELPGLTTAQKNAVATLMYHCGVATEMMYGDKEWGGSGTYTGNYGSWSESDNAQNALYNYFNYKKATSYVRSGYEYEGTVYYDAWNDDDWTAMVKAELANNHPIMYGGAGDEGGHSFICDGYDDQNYFHFNWGWSGQNDGWYKLDNLVPGSGGAGGGSFAFNEDQDVIIGIVPNRTDYPKVTITWSVKGETTTTEFTQEDPLVLPANPADCSADKVFVGWTESSSVTGDKPADLFTSATGKVVTTAKTYYAVFATKIEGGGTSIEKATSIAVGDKVILVYETDSKELSGISSTSTKYGLGQDYTDTPTGVFPLDVVQGNKTGTFALMNGSNYLSWTSGNSLTTTGSLTDNSSWNISFSSGDAVIKNSSDETRSIRWNSSSPRFACYTGGQKAVQLYKMGSGASYSNYSTSCGEVPQPCALTDITLNTDNVKKDFFVGDAFTSAGLVVTAAYSNCENKVVTPVSISTPEMSTVGTKTVTVTYTENAVTKTKDYTITVAEKPVVVTYTVKWHSCDGVKEVVYNKGAALVFPTTPTPNAGKTFYGWITDEYYTGATAPAIISAGTPVNADADYYAVYE
ncbi:MAG: C10 family peptidase [Paludibacteraceae bacterium]|nr:C10 family peptidase [Paludibacteraceae bacterium]